MEIFTKVWYFIGNTINLLSFIILSLCLFNYINLELNEIILFAWLNIITHITQRTKNIQKDE